MTAIRGTMSAGLRGEGVREGVNPKSTKKFVFDAVALDDHGWREARADGQLYSARGLAEYCAKLLLTTTEKSARSS